jgi:hypothetical protein
MTSRGSNSSKATITRGAFVPLSYFHEVQPNFSQYSNILRNSRLLCTMRHTFCHFIQGVKPHFEKCEGSDRLIAEERYLLPRRGGITV